MFCSLRVVRFMLIWPTKAGQIEKRYFKE